MSFSWTWKQAAVIDWVLVSAAGEAISGANVTATLYSGRSASDPQTTPGRAVDGMDGIVLIDQGNGLYLNTVNPQDVAGPGSYTEVIDAFVGGVLIGHWEVPARITTSGNIDLCSLDDVKDWLGVTDGSQDDKLARLITSTSNDFLSRIRRPNFTPAIDHKEHIEVKNWQSERHMEDVFLRNYPVNSIASVTVNGMALPEFDEADPAVPGWFFDEQLPDEERQKITLMGFYYPIFGTWSSPWRSIYRPPAARVIVEYNAGYNDVPSQVEQAIIEWVGFKKGLAQLQTSDPTSQSLYIGSYRQDTMVGNAMLKAVNVDMPESVARVIEIYQRPII